jgi:8-oxo-dGTP pyrophosphatase MutT (NUDIX family)
MSTPPKKPPVTLRQRRLGGQNTKWDVFWDDIRGEDGSTVENYLVIAPRARSATNIGGVTVLPIMADGRIGLVRMYRHPLELEAWEAPRGFLDPGETDYAAAALRELVEETGLIGTPEKTVALGTFAHEASTLIAKGALFVALDCQAGVKPDHVEPGLGELAFFTLDEVLDLADRDEIQDSATLITLYRYALGRRPK